MNDTVGGSPYADRLGTCSADQLFPLLYDELRSLAASKMARENYALTLQPTALVHEAWLRLGGDLQPRWENQAHFLAAAVVIIRISNSSGVAVKDSR